MLVASETGRRLSDEVGRFDAVISVVTLAELTAGVLAADTVDVRSRRLATLEAVADVEVLMIDERVAAEWARLRVRLVEVRRRINVNDLWIAATAVARDLPLVTQDDDFDALDGLVGLDVVRV